MTTTFRSTCALLAVSGLVVSARTTAPTQDPRPSALQTGVDSTRSAMTVEEQLGETLRATPLATEIPVKVSTYTFRDVESGRLKVVIATEIHGGRNPTDRLSLAYTITDNRGRRTAIQFDEAGASDLSIAGGTVRTYSATVLVDPGLHTLKMAVLDAGGRRGSVEHTFRALLQSTGQIRFGDLMLARVRGRGAAAVVQPVADPDAVTDSLHAYLEMYSGARAQLEAATVELEVATAPTARALESASLRMQPVERGGRRTAEGSVPLAFLPPGGYVARAAVSVSNRLVARVTRSFRITRPLPPAADDAENAASTMLAASPRLAVEASVDRFDSAHVLSPDVVGFFLDRMYSPGTAPPSAAVRAIIDHARAGRFDAVVAEVGRVGPATAGELTPTFLHGLALLSRGDVEAAAGRFQESLRLSSELLPAAFYLGACYAAGGRDREAVGAWQTALVTEDDAPFVYTLLGDALLRLNQSVQAVDILREARQLWPDSDEVGVRLALAHTMAGNGREALDAFDPYFDRHPGDHERLFVAMRLLYETAAAGRSIGSPEADAGRFSRYAAAYAAAGGPQEALVEQWREYLRGGRR